MPGRNHLLVIALIAIGALATGAAAATMTVTEVGRPRPGRLRIGVRYEASGRARFRAVPTCPEAPRSRRSLPATVTLSPGRKQAFIELQEDLVRLGPPPPCPVAGLTVEMVQRGRVVARAEIPNVPPSPSIAAPSPPPPPSALPSRLGFAGGKYLAPQTRMSQAGVTWSLTNRLTLHLSYERTAFAPVMSRDHDDGIVTGLKLCF
jgi:hypothetical protein